MKLKYFFSFVAALALLFTSCDENEYDVITNSSVQVSQSYVALPIEGGSKDITVYSNADWTIEADSVVLTWLNVSALSGAAGESQVTFSADAYEGRSATITVVCGAETQIINIIQGLTVVQPATVKEVLDGPVGKTYRVTGTVTKIANTTYGNIYINDGSCAEDLYIYGVLTPSGENKKWSTLGVEVGDIITLEGPKILYYSTVELENATFISVEKSLIKVGAVSPKDATLPIEGGEFTVGLNVKGQGVTVDIPADAKEWLNISAIQSAKDTATVVFNVAENKKGDRKTILTFYTTDGEKDYSAQIELKQKGSFPEGTIGAFLGEPVDETKMHTLKGVIKNITNTKFGNMYIYDYTTDLQIYGTTNFADFASAKAGDVVILEGPRSEHNGNPQMKNAVIKKHVPVTAITAAEFNALEDNNDTYYMLTGKVKSIVKEDYGNIYIEDETGEAYIYGVLDGIEGNSKNFASLGIKVGDTIKLITIKTSYKDAAQGKNAWYVGTVE